MSHGISWHPRISISPLARPRNFQGCTATLPQEVRCFCLLLRLPHTLLLQPGYINHHLVPPKASINWHQRPGRQRHAGLTLLTLQLSQFQGCRWSAHWPTATRRPCHLHCSPFTNRFPIAHIPVPKHHLHCSPLGGLITNRSSTTSLLPKPLDQLRSHWPMRVSAKLSHEAGGG